MTSRTRRATPAPTQDETTILGYPLARPKGATIAELTRATGWQSQSVRGALAGPLKHKGHSTTTELTSGLRRNRSEAPQ